MQYVEDQLRTLFFDQHPWELSRPKILVENSLEERFDWSHIQQLGKPLDGESVVQRTMYLLKTDKMDMITAYNQARFEFYRFRIQQEVEEQVAQEEAEMFGSVFNQSMIDFGIEKEQKVIQQWKKKAEQETELVAARRANPSDSWISAEAGATEENLDEQGSELLEL